MRIDLTARSRTLLLVGRDLRLSAHAYAPILLRAGLVIVMIVAMLVGEQWSRVSAAPGLTLLTWATELDYWVLVLCGVGLFPSLLLSEREQGSFDLLRLSGCGPAAFLLGRSLGVLLQLLLCGLVQLPFLLLIVALGGVGMAQIGACLALLGCHALLVYGAALLASARAPSLPVAIRRAAVLVALLTCGPAWLAAVLRWAMPSLRLNWLVAALEHMSLRLPYGLMPSWRLDPGAAGWPPLRDLLLVGGVLVVVALCWFRVKSGAMPTERARARRVARYPLSSPVRAWASRGLGGGWKGRGLFAAAVGLAIWVGSARVGQFLGGIDLIALMLCQAAVMILHAAWLGALSTRAHVADRTLPLLQLTDARPAWLTQLRLGRWPWLVLHGVLLLATVLAMFGSHDDLLPFVVASLGVALAADAAGERCGLAVRGAPLAVSLLLAFGFGAVALTASALIARTRPAGVFLGCGVAFGALAVWLYRRNSAALRRFVTE